MDNQIYLINSIFRRSPKLILNVLNRLPSDIIYFTIHTRMLCFVQKKPTAQNTHLVFGQHISQLKKTKEHFFANDHTLMNIFILI